MKALPWILVVFLAGMILYILNRPAKYSPGEAIRDTVMVIDTIRDTVPIPYKVTVMRTDTFYLPILVGDSLSTDSVSVVLPVEQKEYKTEQYRAVISGIRPNLDFIETYNEKQIITLTPKLKRWGLGLQAGYGYPDGAYVGVGVSYNLFIW